MNRVVNRVKIYVGSIIIVSIALSLVLYYAYANFNQERIEELVAKELVDLNNYLMTNLTIIRTPGSIQDIYLNKLLDRCIQLINSIDDKIGGYDGDREIIVRFNKIKSIILNINTIEPTTEKRGRINQLYMGTGIYLGLYPSRY